MKTKILRLIGTLNPEYGGPAKAIIDHSHALIQQGYDVSIVTSDHKYKRYYKEKKIKIINLGPAIGEYKLNFKLFFWLKKNRYKFNNFFVHGLWQFNTLAARLLLKNNFFVFSHGQLDPYFKSEIFKCLKKKVYWALIEKKNLLYSKSLLLTSDNEKKLIKNTYVNTNDIKKKVVEYGILKPKINIKDSEKLFYSKFKKLKNIKYFIFLGRFHKKKGCEIILKVLEKFKKKKIKVKVLMVGPNNNYKKTLIKRADILKINDMIIWSDTLIGGLKWVALKKSEAMILPSHGENFGVSLVEAMSLSKPIITTNKVNIFTYISFTKSGIITSNNLNSFYKGVTRFLNLSKSEKKKMSKNSYSCFLKYFNLINNLKSFKNLLI